MGPEISTKIAKETKMNVALLTLIATTTTDVVESAISRSFFEDPSALYTGQEAVKAAKTSAALAACPACLGLVETLERRLRDAEALQALHAENRELEFQLRQVGVEVE